MWNNSNNSTVQNNATEVEDSLPFWNQGQNAVPVMIQHLNRYGDDLKIWGMPVRMVTTVAIVDAIEIDSTRVNFKFRDETGTISGMKWLDSETTSYESPVKVNSYARIYGNIRSGQDKNYVLVANIQPMEHLNELLAHLMEVTKMCLEGEHFANQAAHNRSSSSNNGSTANHDTTVSAGSSTNNESYANLNRDQSIIMDIISRGDPNDGAERSSIKSHVPAYLVPQVDGILEFLSAEGHIYTTKTDNWFKKL